MYVATWKLRPSAYTKAKEQRKHLPFETWNMISQDKDGQGLDPIASILAHHKVQLAYSDIDFQKQEPLS